MPLVPPPTDNAGSVTTGSPYSPRSADSGSNHNYNAAAMPRTMSAQPIQRDPILKNGGTLPRSHSRSSSYAHNNGTIERSSFRNYNGNGNSIEFQIPPGRPPSRGYSAPGGGAGSVASSVTGSAVSGSTARYNGSIASGNKMSNGRSNRPPGALAVGNGNLRNGYKGANGNTNIHTGLD